MRKIDKYNLLKQSGFTNTEALEKSRLHKKEFVKTIFATGKEEAIKQLRDIISVAPEVRVKDSPIEVGYKSKYVYIIKLKYANGDEKYVNYSTNLPPEKISRAKIYNMVQRFVIYEYNQVLEKMNIETMLQNPE